MANTILTPTEITRKTGLILRNSLGFGKRCARRYDERFAVTGAKIGSTLDVRIPPRYLVTKAEALTTQDSTETKRTLTVGYAHVGLIFSQTDLVLSVNSFADQFLNSAAAALGNQIDLDGTELYKSVFNVVGTTGSGAPTSLATYQTARAKLIEESVPQDGAWTMAINAAMEEKIIADLRGLFESNLELRRQYEEGEMRKAIGFAWKTDQNMFVHTCGTRVASGAAQVDGIQTGSSLLLKLGGNALTVKKGDAFTIADVYAVNPQSRQSTGRLRQFVVTADATSTAGGAITLAIYPAITPSGKDQTVNAAIVDSAAIIYNGAASAAGAQGLAFQKEAFSLTMVDQELPEGVHFAGRVSGEYAREWNIALRLVRQYTISDNQIPCRIDALYGWLCGRPEAACRVAA